MTIKYKKELIGVRANEEFLFALDDLCEKLGQKRSTVVRYALRKFIAEHIDNNINLKTAYSEML